MCTCIELEFEGLCWSCVDEIHEEQRKEMQKAYLEYQPSEDELPF
jgi:hypothetical protein